MVAEQSKASHKNVAAIYPLSPMQEGMLFHSLYAPDSGTYCSQTLITLNGELNLGAFKQAWEKVVERHAVLRTLFLWEKRQKTLQIVRKQVDLPWNYSDWQPLSPREQQQQLDALLKDERQRGFALNQAPLMRCHLIQLSQQSYHFLWNRHHILLDGWSGAIIYGEVLQIYQALCQEQNPYLSPARPYEDYIVWLQQQDQSLAENFWRRSLKNFTTPTNLGITRSILVEPQSKPVYQSADLSLSPGLTEKLQTLAQQQNLTLSTLIQAAWAILLSRYSGESEVLFGITVSGRPASLSGIEKMVGLFINTLPLRVTVTESETILPWLEELQQKQAEIQDYAYSSLAEIQRLSDVLPGLPLFESLVIFENYPREERLTDSPQQLSVSGVIDFEETNYPLTVAVIPKQALQFQFSYDVSHFTHESIIRLTGHLETLLTAIAQNPQQSLGQLPLLTAAERHQLLVEWNDTAVDYPQHQCLHHLVEEQVLKTPEAIAVIFEGQELTYQALNERANQLAHYLQEKGVKPEVLVGIYFERSLEAIIGILAILKAGGAYVPLDPTYPRDRLDYMLTDSAVSILLTQQSLVTNLREDLDTLKIESFCLDSDWLILENYSRENPSSSVQSENLAYLIYTSGSTGKPKGVMNLHQGICNNILRTKDSYPTTNRDRLLQISSLAFDASVLDIFWSLSSGMALIIPKPEGNKDPAYLIQLMIEKKVSQVFFVPSLLRLLLQQPNLENCRYLKRVFCGGEALSSELMQQFFQHFNCELHNLYGPTETSVDATCWQCPPRTDDPAIAIGRPIANTQIYILDRHLQPVPVGIVGELHIGGIQLARGYLNQLELTAEKFIPNPFAGGRLYKTGDLVRYLADGNIEYLGRIDNQVKLRGLRIELGEIQTILDSHPQINQSVVIIQTDSEDNQRLVAYIASQHQALTPKELRQFLQPKLPAYMIPSAFVILPEFPLNPNGKVDLKKLPLPNETALVESVYVAPRNPTETILVNIWQEVLSLAKIGINDNFFELGGHSLKAITLVSKIQEKMGIAFAIKQVFSHPTIAEQASLLTETKNEENLAILPIPHIPDQIKVATSHAQKRFFVLQQMDLNNVAYHITSILKLTGEFAPDKFKQAMQLLIDRHESLRTAFVLTDGEPQQKVLLHRPFSLVFEDWTEEFNAESRILEILQEQRKPFDLEKDPLLRSSLYQLSPQSYILFLEIHHIICDGWSMNLLAKECLGYYQALRQELEPTVEPLPIQYRDYAAWQNNQLKQKDQNKNLDYWRQKLDNGQIPRVHLPTDFLRSPLKSYNGSHLSWILPTEINLQLRKVCQDSKSTLFMALVAAVKVLLYRYSGQQDISIGTEIATRNHPQLQELIGLFLNTLILRDRLDPDQGYQDCLSKIRQTVSEALAHSDYPFDRLLEDLNISREINRTPLFDVLVLLQNFDQTPTIETLNIQSLDSLTPTSKFDLSFVFSENQENIRLDLIYNTDLFQKERMEKCLLHFDKLLTAMLANPEQPIGKISLLSDSETALIEDFIRPIPRLEIRTVLDDFADQVRIQSHLPALVYTEDGLTKQLSYQELDQLTDIWANNLNNLGIEKESICGVSLEGDYRQVIAMLAVFKARGIYLPLRLDEPEERWQRMIVKTSPAIILIAAENLEMIKPRLLVLAKPPNLLVVNHQEIQQYYEWNGTNYQEFSIVENNNRKDLLMPDADDANYIIFTSGSTGEPKAILGSHGSLRHFINWEKIEFGINHNWRCLQIAQINFDPYLRETLVTLCSGGTLYIPDSIDREDLERLLLRLGEWQINLLHTVPSVMRLFLNIGRNLPNANQLLKNLQVLVLGGEPLFVKELCEWHEVFGNQTEFVNIYGASETTFIKHFHRIPKPNNISYARVPGGKTLPDAAFAVIDENRPCAIGEVGEIFVKSPYLTKGYYQDEILTNSVFVPNPLNNGNDLVYRTGDLGRLLPDLTLEVIGRRSDNQIKLNGVRIELGEIEDAVAAIDGVQKALVIADKKEELVTVIAYYQGNNTVNREQISQKLKQVLPTYMQPTFLIQLESFPLLPNGKIHRLALPKPEGNITQSISQPTGFNQQEALLALVWGELLEIEVSDNNQSFFELGGNSLKAMRLVSQIRNQFGVSLRLREIFTHNILKEQAILIQSRQTK